MRTVGLTGGIGSGKSAVSRMLAERGALVIDADVIAREVVAPGTSGLARIRSRFGPDVLAPDGSLDRPALAAVVFADAQARADLEGIVHPLVRARSAELTRAAPPDSVVVHDIPLLVENRLQDRYDVIVVVDVPEATQIDRLVRLRGMSADDAAARIRAQASRDERLAAADFVLDNSAGLAELERQVDELWRRLAAKPR